MLEQYRKAIEIAQMGLWNWNPITNEVNWSDEKFALFGYDPQEFELNMETAFKTVFPDDVAHIGKVLDANLPSEDYFEYSYRGVKKQGDIIHVWVRVQVDRDEEGNPIMIHGISQDRTAQLKLEGEVRELNKNLEKKVAQRTSELALKNEQNEFLVREMHHRVKNNLQVISSILNLQKTHIKDESSLEALELCVKRIKSMAIIHDSLYKYENLSQIRLQKYLKELIKVYNTENNIQFELEIADRELGLDLMVPVGLILNELIANSSLHAFNNVNKGKISININFNDAIQLSYKDNGEGFNPLKSSLKPSFGIEMIKTLSDGLEGEYSINSSPGKGFEFNLSAPMADVAVSS